MTVIDCIAQSKHEKIKYEVDGVLYDTVIDIPESVKCMDVLSYIYFMIDELVLKMRTEKTHRIEDCFVW